MKKPMTKRRIEQYISLRREIVMLEGQILSAETTGGEYLSDVVQGSSKSLPYKKHSVVIKGYGSRAVPRLCAKKADLEAECDAVERYIEMVDDSVLRQLLTRRYIEGRTLSETAELVGYSEAQTKRHIKNFLEKMSRNDPK